MPRPSVVFCGVVAFSQQINIPPGSTDESSSSNEFCEDGSDVCLLQLKQNAASSSTVSTSLDGPISALAVGNVGDECYEACKDQGVERSSWMGGKYWTRIGPCDFCGTGGVCCAYMTVD